MAKVDSAELYPLFYALHRHVQEQNTIVGVKLDDEVLDAVNRFSRKHGGKPIASEKPITPERVKSIIKAVKHDPKIRILICEDGPEAKRPKTQEELIEEQEAEEAEAARLIRKFFVSATYGTIAFVAAQVLIIVYINVTASEPISETGPQMESNDPTGRTLHPLQIAALICIVIAAWGIAEAVVIAKNHWADFDRVKGAVPVIGPAWLARTKRKRREKEKQMAGAKR